MKLEKILFAKETMITVLISVGITCIYMIGRLVIEYFLTGKGL